MTDHENDHGDIRYKYLQIGVVVAADDPMGLSRVRVRIPGLIETQSGWAFPLGAPGGGAAGKGLKITPRVGSEVGVLFKGGDPDCPYYLPAQWGAPGGTAETPTVGENFPASSTGNPAGQAGNEIVDVYESEQYIVTVDNNAGTKVLRIKDKIAGDMIEMDGTSKTGPGITIYGTAAVYIKSDGQVIIDALSATICGRTVTPSSNPIG
jgi:uncharacterized protein involved in type VI secretion and phage assembly